MEIGVELRDIRFHRPGCYRLAVVCQIGDRRLAHVSEPSEICATPKWKSTAWRLQTGKDDTDLHLQFRLHESNSSDCRSVLESAPLSRCSFDLPLQRLRSVLTSSQELVAPEKLEVSSSRTPFAPAAQLEKLQSMNQALRKTLHLLAMKLSAMQQSLNVVSAHEADLLKEQEQLLSDMKRLELTLKELKEPYMTDLDVELLLSMPQGARKMANVLLAAEQRWKDAREEVIGRWAEFTSLRQKLGEVQQLQKQLKDFQQAMITAQLRCEERSAVLKKLL
eukprot:Skav210448  [mRNA]  locus=scaffold1297:175402:178522:+ [translate_table: standard]